MQSEYEYAVLNVVPGSLGFTVVRMYNDGTPVPQKDRWLIGPSEDLALRLRELHRNPTYSPEVTN